MKNAILRLLLFCIVLLFAPLFALSGCFRGASADQGSLGAALRSENSPAVYALPPPVMRGAVSVEEALAARRSRRNFSEVSLSAQQVSQILWAAYGITQPMAHPQLRGGFRTTPSAGAVFPLEIYLVVGGVQGMEAGVYRYDSQAHTLTKVIAGDIREALAAAALGQPMIRDAPVTLVYTADFARIVAVYGERGRLRYVWLEAGHSSQNVYLQAVALGLGTVAVGAFIDSAVSSALQLPPEREPLYLMPVGYFR